MAQKFEAASTSSPVFLRSISAFFVEHTLYLGLFYGVREVNQY